MRRPAVGKRPRQSIDETALAATVGRRPAAGDARRVGARRRMARQPENRACRPQAQSLLTEHAALENLLAGIAEAAPYLWDLIGADPARFLRLVTADPDRALAALLARTKRGAALARTPAPLMRALRRMKAQAALLVALADIGGVWSVARVTAALTDVAETALGAAVHHLLRDAVRRGRLAAADPSHPEAGSGYIVLAMGKMGGHELNFSSDIDLMVFFDTAAHPALPRVRGRAGSGLAPDVEPIAFYVRLTRDLVKLLQERTADGYVFRVDLRLRPDPASTQIAISAQAALDYYESRGQNWERAALIKARVCAGDVAAGEALLRALSPFVWRKYLDYATIADVHAMKQQIHAYRGHGDIAVEGHNIKLGRGGIREIEFFAQTQQLIAGGRHSELRGRETVATLAALAAGGWIDAAARDALTAAYYFLRRVEHRLQMMADEQTHTLPSDPHELGGFARFLGYRDRDAFAEISAGAFARGRAALREAVRGHAGALGGAAEPVVCSGRPGAHARPAGAYGFSPAAGHRRGGAALGGRAISRLARRAGARVSHRASSRHHRSIRPSRASGRGLRRVRPFPRRVARRRALAVAVAAESGADPLCRPDPRRRAAARRHPGAASASDRPADRSELLCRAARRREVGERAGAPARRHARLRGRARRHPAVRPGAHVPDRRPHPVGLGLRGSCRRAVRAPRRRSDPGGASSGRRRLRRQPRPHPRPTNRDRGARPAWRPRDDREFRPRSHRHLRFRAGRTPAPTARGRSTARNILPASPSA